MGSLFPRVLNDARIPLGKRADYFVLRGAEEERAPDDLGGDVEFDVCDSFADAHWQIIERLHVGALAGEKRLRHADYLVLANDGRRRLAPTPFLLSCQLTVRGAPPPIISFLLSAPPSSI